MSLILPKVTVKVWFWLIYLKVLHFKKKQRVICKHGSKQTSKKVLRKC